MKQMLEFPKDALILNKDIVDQVAGYRVTSELLPYIVQKQIKFQNFPVKNRLSMFSEDLRPPINILLVEDNAGDIFLIENALKTWTTSCKIYSVEDGEMAMKFLRQQGVYSISPSPQLIFLDLNLPRKDGREVLAEIKADPNLKHIPVIVMTASSSEQDILRSSQLYANCYITKPSDLNQYNQTIQSIENFWLNCAQLPVKT